MGTTILQRTIESRDAAQVLARMQSSAGRMARMIEVESSAELGTTFRVKIPHLGALT